MPIVNYVREHMRFIEYASEENLSASEMLLWYALMHQFNQRAQGNIWPEEFVRIDNDRLLSYLPFGYDALAEARNKLKQRGIIDYVPGERNKKNPTYKITYFYPTYVKSQTEEDAFEKPVNHRYPENPDNMPGKNGGYPENPVNLPVNSPSNKGGNMGGNLPGNMPVNSANNNINYTRYKEYENQKEQIDDPEEDEEATARARAREEAREEAKAAWLVCYGKPLNPYAADRLALKAELLHFEKGVLTKAVELAAYKCADFPMDYIGSLLHDWFENNVKTAMDAERYEALRSATYGSMRNSGYGESDDNELRKFRERRAE